MLSCCCAAKEDEKLASIETQPALPASALAKAAAEEEVAMKVKVSEPVAPKKEVAPAPAPVKQEPTREFIAREFTVELQKVPGKALGFELDPLDTQTLHIVTIQEDGLIADHNRSCTNPVDKVMSGDIIVSINGVGGSNDPMVDCLKKNSNLKIMLRRLTTWEVTLQQKGNSIRSCLNRATNGKTVLILSTENQAFTDWNMANPSKDIRANDRIIKVDGVSGEAKKLIDTIDGLSTLTLELARPSPYY